MEQPNQSYIDSLSGGDQAFKQQLIDVIKLEYPQEKQEYLDNINSQQLKLVADNVHKLKHKISILGLEKSYDVAVDYENNLLKGNTDQREAFEAILNTITKYLKTL
ncbi:hypothetical protein [Lacinutrix sp. 5H-3-7-4]|uniref:hypothetical protein n=1 Tax=Lacinutrix sp. (strain 5H-3-7-4) TaxID=983544 RepID=UPI00020A38CD|nr:hypothetical protein [Lacinutrix sp. 5H-3-7-4]AEH01186.1 hypothetical protein Lacal_1338 [Lacinutrix sp. 5H-3-7-4]